MSGLHIYTYTIIPKVKKNYLGKGEFERLTNIIMIKKQKQIGRMAVKNINIEKDTM